MQWYYCTLLFKTDGVKAPGGFLCDIFDDILWYACDYWAIHLRGSLFSIGLVKAMEDFGTTSLLCWIGALSLGNEID